MAMVDTTPPDEIMREADTVGWKAGLQTIRRVTALSFRSPWMVTIALVSTLIAAVLQLLIPVLLGRAVDQTQMLIADPAGAEAATSALWTTALLVLAASVGRGVFTTFQNYFSESVGHRVGYALRLAYYEKIQRLSFGFHDRVHSGDLITLGMLDLEGVRMFFSTGLVRILLLGILIGIGGYMLLSTDFVLGLLALSFVPFVAWRSSVSQLKLRGTWLELQNRLSVLSRVMEENLAGIRVVRAFGAQPFEMQKFATASTSALELAHERVDIRVRNTSAMTLSFFLAMGLVLWVGSGKVTNGEISVGTLTAFLTFMTILQMPVRQLGMLVNSFARTATCGERIFSLLDLDLAITDKPDAKPLEITEGVVQFVSVGFTYPTAKTPTLSNLSFSARKGETIGLIGPPGSGKSTIAHLVPRFYDVTSGRITIDGQDIRDVTLASLRHAVVVVQQDAFLFTTSLENNIAYGDPWAPPQQIADASASAQLAQFIATLPAGYETVVGERGASLSGGQRQRMTIARTLMLRPTVLIFDDSTAAVDAGTEQRIRATIQAQAAERVTIIVAHRLNSLMHADRILFIEEGQIVEQGTHRELLALNGRYAALHRLQVRPDDAAGDADTTSEKAQS
ncbi:ABC transporter ATP-binding protein [Flavimaricola marinus]|uniref:Putative multidrug export ATP-binding/permease protein n=1 Tax=Flavimaricola marinus TaxID=1819565 RepID=A0A238L957_9RHOB|nr:ABC transporter ATP-binding protein [Flavimaricola marinus]SMY06112.1 Putative multidrug export ATP-binding/permease protein [Flavimaricola marinus]